MTKLIFKYWIINLLFGITLFFIYRFTTIETNISGENWFEKFITFFNILGEIVFSMIYIIGILICSSTLLLNLKKNIRNNYYLSFLTYLGLPFICIIVLIILLFRDNLLFEVNIITTFLFFIIIYTTITSLEFSIFRKKIKKYESNK